MCMLNSMPIFAIVPMTILLTVSFFVLLVARKTDVQGLKVFGFVVAALLWVCAAIMLSMVIQGLSGRRGMMHQGQMPQAPMQNSPMMHQGK